MCCRLTNAEEEELKFDSESGKSAGYTLASVHVQNSGDLLFKAHRAREK